MTTDRFRTLDDNFLVSGQIAPEDIEGVAAMGVRVIVNNRPDGEEHGQPCGDEIRTAAEAVGVSYEAIPIGPAGVSTADLDRLDAACADRQGKVLAYCRSGARSTIVWALCAARAGASPDDIIEKAGAAGHDIAGHRPLLTTLQQG